MSKEALRLADALCNAGLVGAPLDSEVAAELRRLAALNAELVEALEMAMRYVVTEGSEAEFDQIATVFFKAKEQA